MSLKDYDNDRISPQETHLPVDLMTNPKAAIDVKTMVKRFDKPYKASKNNKHLKKTFTAYQ